MMYRFAGHGWGMGFGWIFGLILIGLIIWFIVTFTGQNSRHYFERRKSALDILNERYAKGEISREEYKEKKKDIS